MTVAATAAVEAPSLPATTDPGPGPKDGQVASGPAQQLVVTTLAERPDLKDAVVQLSLGLTTPRPGASRDWGWPVFLYKGEGGSKLYDLFFAIPEYQTLVIKPAGNGQPERLLAVGYATPCTWDGTVEGLPEGWDEVIRRGHAMRHDPAAIAAANCMSALAVEVAVDAQGCGISSAVLGGMKAIAMRHGKQGLLAPIRPVLKPMYPLIPMDEYVTWMVPDKKSGEAPSADGGQQAMVLFDPWLRTHTRLGARVLKVAHTSCTVAGTVADWEAWTPLRLLSSGRYTMPGGLVPLEVDLDANRGVYVEPNVWVAHRL